MSYILDALRRAQAERERGQVPGLEARTLVQTPPPQPPRRAAAWWLGGGLVLALLVTAAVLVWRGNAAPAPSTAARQAQAASTAAAVSAVAATSPGPLPAPQPPMVVVSVPTAPPALPAPPLAQPVYPAALNAPLPLPLPLPAAATAAATAAAPAATPAVPGPPAGGVRAVQLAQLSPELRRELPALTLGGAIWSDNAASRFVIVNGQVLREGDAAAPGVLLERIGPKAVFLRWRDWRLEVPI